MASEQRFDLGPVLQLGGEADVAVLTRDTCQQEVDAPAARQPVRYAAIREESVHEVDEREFAGGGWVVHGGDYRPR